MNRSFNQADFEAAIQGKDYIKLKNYIINSIRNNPRFTHAKTEKACEATIAFRKLRDMKEELPGLFSSYKLQDGEIEFDEEQKDTWTQEYFIRQTFLLEENFCAKRFKNVKKIGQYLSKGNFIDPQEVMEGYESAASISDSVNTTEIVDNNPCFIIVTIVVAIIILFVGILADLKMLSIIGIVLMVTFALLAILKYKRRR